MADEPTIPQDGQPSVGRVVVVPIESEMRQSYLDYAMSVIVSRALPDVRDGLKPVHRRILHAMQEMGLRPNQSYKKSAKVVGEVLGKYHPHGDTPVYDALVRMAQDFSMRYPLVDGQGNFGSVDNDPPAAMRYTECRLTPIAMELLADIDRSTVDFAPNYDGSEREPVVLPSRIPNLLINGSSGIAVGMATNIPPHNLGEVADAIARLIDSPETSGEELLHIIRGPDFPTAGIIIGRQGIVDAYTRGRGRVIVRARTHIEEMARAGRYQIVVTELPFQVNKAELVSRIADLVRDRKVDGISDLRDESDRHGLRVVIELKREAQPRAVLNQLYKHTQLQTTFAIHMLCLVNSEPRTVTLKEALREYIEHRRIVIRRKAEFDLAKLRDREHILSGLLQAVSHIDAIIRLIRQSESAAKAKEQLMLRPYRFSERQADAILEMQLRRLAALERKQLEDEYAQVVKGIRELEELLADPHKVDQRVRDDAMEVKKKYGDDRRTQIVEQELDQISDEDLIAHQTVVVTLSQRGYVKRVPLDTYRRQRRGGKGVKAVTKREEDAVQRLLVCDTHDHLLLFTDRGRVFQLKAYELPDASRVARGEPIINHVAIEPGEMVTSVVPVREFRSDSLVLATRHGEVKRSPLEEFQDVRRNGIRAMDLEEADELVSARLANDGDDVVLVSAGGKAVRFSVRTLRVASRASGGVRGIALPAEDRVVSLEVASAGSELLVISEHGFGKRTKIEEFPTHNRGGQGVIAFNVVDKTGAVVTARMVEPNQDLMVITREGIVMRTQVGDIRLTGRAASGVQVMRPHKSDAVVSIATLNPDEAPAEQARQQQLALMQDEANGATPRRRSPRRRAAEEDDGHAPA